MFEWNAAEAAAAVGQVEHVALLAHDRIVIAVVVVVIAAVVVITVVVVVVAVVVVVVIVTFFFRTILSKRRISAPVTSHHPIRRFSQLWLL